MVVRETDVPSRGLKPLLLLLLLLLPPPLLLLLLPSLRLAPLIPLPHYRWRYTLLRGGERCLRHRHTTVTTPLHYRWQVESERARKWVKIKASLLRDSRGQFKIVVKEDQGGFYLDAIMETDVRPH